MRTRGERLKFALELRGMGTNELDRAIGESGWASRVARDMKPRAESDLVMACAQTLRVRFMWLEWGLGPMDGAPDSESYLASELGAPGVGWRTSHPLQLAINEHPHMFAPEIVKKVWAKKPSFFMTKEDGLKLLIEEKQAQNRKIGATAKKRAGAPTPTPAATPSPATKRRAG